MAKRRRKDMANIIPVNNQHLQRIILRQVNAMRTSKKHCDFLIKVGSEEIPVHRNIICATSNYFDAMLSHPTTENESGVVEMIGVDPECVIICVNHMYGKEVSILPEKYEPLMFAAGLMQLHKLCDAIATLLEASLNLKMFFIAKRIADMYGLKKLEEKCNEFAEVNFGLISKEEEFGELDKSCIERLIKWENKKICDEVKLAGLLVWIKNDPERSSMLDDLMSNIDLVMISAEGRRYLMESEPLVRDDFTIYKKFGASMLNTMGAGRIDIRNRKNASSIVVFDRKSRHLQCFNLQNNEWKQMQKMNDHMMKFSAAVIGDSIYTLMDDKSVYRLKYHDKSASWEKMADMKREHGPCPPVAVLSGILYVIGGSYKCRTKSVELYIPSANKWIELKDKLCLAQSPAVLSSRRYIYSFGGIGSKAYIKTVERFDPTSSTWTELSPMIEAKGYLAAVERGGRIYVSGGVCGSNEGQKFASMHCYHKKSNSWTILQPMTRCRCWFRTFAIDGSIYAVGGLENSNNIEKYDVEKNEWTRVRIPEDFNLAIMESVKVEFPL